MSWLTPLGFLGFIGLIILIIIYIIKPNYQNKIISSTFIWKLSLKLKKKKIPINTLRNVLLFICQVLVISMAAMILARPVIAEERKPEMREKIRQVMRYSGPRMIFHHPIAALRHLYYTQQEKLNSNK